MYSRTDKTSQLIQEALARLIQSEIRDPRLPKLITLSRVTVSPDLSHASIYITTLEGEKTGKQAVDVLNHAAGFLRTALVKAVRLRIAPRLHFRCDDQLEEAQHLSNLITRLNLKE